MITAIRRFAFALLAPALLIFLVGCSDAQDEAAAGTPPNPLLFEIASADGTVEGWMVGTIHALPSGVKWRTPAIAGAVRDADMLIVEVEALDDRTALARTFANLATGDGLPPLRQRVAADLIPALDELLSEGRLDERVFATTETWAVALKLAQIKADGDPANATDRAFIREFAGRPVHEFEGAARQLAIFDRLAEADQRALLTAVVKSSRSAQDDGARLRRAWLTGDAAAIEAATRSGILAHPSLRNALLVQRNRDWSAAIVPILEAQPRPLIAVGAAHLVGAEGLASLLQAQGYRVRRLP